LVPPIKEEHRLRMFESNVLTKKFQLKREETGDWGKLAQ
jgi:hypothetical protein